MKGLGGGYVFIPVSASSKATMDLVAKEKVSDKIPNYFYTLKNYLNSTYVTHNSPN